MPAGISGVRLRQQAEGAASHKKADSAFGGGA